MRRLVTRSQFARREHISPARVTQYVQSGLIRLINGKIDPLEAEARIAANVDSRKIDWQKKVEARKEPDESPELITDYPVLKQFTTRIDGFRGRFLIPVGTIMRVYSHPGSERVEIAFFPGDK